jgi:hypothetical protein
LLREQMANFYHFLSPSQMDTFELFTISHTYPARMTDRPTTQLLPEFICIQSAGCVWCVGRAAEITSFIGAFISHSM